MSTSTSIHHRDKIITEMMDEKKGHAEDEAKHIKQHVLGCIYVRKLKRRDIFLNFKKSKNRLRLIKF